jgi:repressor LexA
MQEKSLIKKNILHFIDFKGITKYKFYQDTGITRGILDQNNGMSEENTAIFLAYYSEVNSEWLLTGRGSMLKSSDEIIGIPLVSIKAVGGFGSADFVIQKRDVKEHYIIPKFRDKQVDFMIEVEGSSMYPKYSSGDVVACRILHEQNFIQWNQTHVIATKEQGLIIKRVKKGVTEGSLIMISDNKDYPEFEVPKKEITGIALVIGVIRLE